MRTRLELLGFSLILVLSVCSLACTSLLRVASATYVEGAIVQDTIWTLVDSPFVLSNDVVVYPNTTLTIEPGVSVRFGGSYSLTVEGRLLANGEKDRMIRFSSNRPTPEPGDWATIWFTGTQLSSLAYCMVEYGTDGISVSNGNVDVRNSGINRCLLSGIYVTNGQLLVQGCNISLCLQNGINATDSQLTVRGNLVSQNNVNGIFISGHNNAVIQNNTIMANANGIAISGNVTSGVNIAGNVIAANSKDGILFDADVHSDTVITNNTISSNGNGVHVSTATSTYIAGNAIAFNTENGFLYREGDHVTYHNDIYANVVGMDADFGVTVNAEYNYWGDASGPYSASLNPTGRGDPVEGNGINIDFIFFLAKPIGHINIKPTARLMVDRILVPGNETVMFFATGSTDEGRVDRYLYDFDDGNNSGWTTLSIFAHQYSSLGTYHASLTVIDDFGAVSDKATVTVTVQNLPPLEVDVDASKTIVNEGEQVTIVVHVTDGTDAVENATVTLFSLREGNFSPSSGLTNMTGTFATIFTVPDVTDFTNIRVVARASKALFADGSAFRYLEVAPFLSVQINPSSSIVKSEESTPITISVTSNDAPVAGAYVTAASNNGNLSPTAGTTNSDGVFSMVFTAPLTTETLYASLMASARKDGYISGSVSAVITVGPRILDLQVVSAADSMISEAGTDVTVQVTFEATPVEGATVTVRAGHGSFAQTSGFTDINGSITFAFIAPAVSTQTVVVLDANASMLGYAGNQAQTTIVIDPRTFTVTAQVLESSIQSGELTSVTVNVTCNEDGKRVPEAWVAVSCSDGNFSQAAKTTDSNGQCTFIFTSPETTAQITIAITANVTKNGFVSNSSNVSLTVDPKAIPEAEGGFPWITLLLIIIPVVIAVVVIVLIKMKVITVSSKEES